VGELCIDRAAAARYVLSRHDPGSGYSFYRTPEWRVEEPNAPDTFAALRSLRLLGVEIPEPALTAEWLRSLQETDGSFPTITIGWATLCSLIELDSSPLYSPAAWLLQCERALFRRADNRDWSGSLRDMLHLVELFEIVGLSLPTGHIEALLKAARDEHGGWAAPGADLETTAIALLLGLRRETSARGVSSDAASFVKRCEDPVVGLRLGPASAATSVGALWGGVVIKQFLGEALADPAVVRANLAAAQRRDGGLGARHLAISTLHDTWLGLEVDQLLAGREEQRSTEVVDRMLLARSTPTRSFRRDVDRLPVR
jgi:hypothetical protein